VLLPFNAASGRGLHLEPPPWHHPAFVDTSLALGAGMSYASGDTQAVLFPLVLAPIRRGPILFALRWEYLSVRTATGHVYGLGDPRVFARLLLLGKGTGGASLQVEGSARLPTASPRLYPYASGGQELEFAGSLGVPWLFGFVGGAGRIWSEPPAGSTLRSADVPHATHVWGLASRRHRSWALAVRGDQLFMHGGGRRSVVEANLSSLAPGALGVTLGVGLEVGRRRDRIFDGMASLRLVTCRR